MEINELFRPKAGYYIYILHVFFKSHMIVLSLVIPNWNKDKNTSDIFQAYSYFSSSKASFAF